MVRVLNIWKGLKMSVWGFHPSIGRNATTYDRTSKEGDHFVSSFGHPVLGGEFCSHKLGPVIGHSDDGYPLFCMDQITVEMADGKFYPIVELRALRADWTKSTFELGGLTYERGVFGNYRVVKGQR